MRRYNVKKFIGEVLTVVMVTTFVQPIPAAELNTEIASAGAAVAIEDYVQNAGSEEDLAKYLPAPEQPTQQAQSTTKVEKKSGKQRE